MDLTSVRKGGFQIFIGAYLKHSTFITKVWEIVLRSLLLAIVLSFCPTPRW